MKAKDVLNDLLNAGALPIPAKIIEESVGSVTSALLKISF